MRDATFSQLTKLSRKFVKYFGRALRKTSRIITLATFDEFITSIRTEFGEQGAGKKFEVFCKWLLEKDPEWSMSISDYDSRITIRRND
jgi:hypothetical protein